MPVRYRRLCFSEFALLWLFHYSVLFEPANLCVSSFGRFWFRSTEVSVSCACVTPPGGVGSGYSFWPGSGGSSKVLPRSGGGFTILVVSLEVTCV